MHLLFSYGTKQRFRRRYQDINILGKVVAAAMPIRRATYQLNWSRPVPFYVEHVPDLELRAGRAGGWFASPIDWRLAYKDSPAALRLKELGDFNIEIPADTAELLSGSNQLIVEVEDHGKVVERAAIAFDWDPRPVEVPVLIGDLSGIADVQEIAQVVDGRFAIDGGRHAIVSVPPVAPDSLCLLAAPGGSQEATYRITFESPQKSKYLGLSDFFVRHEAEDPPIGIKPGWSTAGLATVRFDGEARCWLAFGDNAASRRSWIVCTDPPKTFVATAGRNYRVRHQVRFHDRVTSARFRIWPEDEAEPKAWLCEESDSAIDPSLPRHTAASFGLFQHTGASTAWSDISVVPLL
jgi:hypothetical protein